MSGWTGRDVPAPARMYDYYLSGKDSYPTDRAAADAVLAIAPEAIEAARENRWFLVSAVRYLAEQGIDQFIDIGAGFPASPDVHEVARSTRPSSRVVYVDNDPVVVAHSRALRAVGMDVVGMSGDARKPEDILTDPVLLRTIDLSRPVGVLMIAVAHFLADVDDPAGIVRVLHAGTVPGSALVLSHVTAPPDSWERAQAAADVYTQHGVTAPMVLRSPGQIAALFADWQLRDGLAPAASWPVPGPITMPTVVGGVAWHD